MKDTELYRQILGIEPPWYIDRVDLVLEDGRVDVWLKHKRGIDWPCPECGESVPLRDHVDERTWRHLDTCQMRTFIKARIPRVECPRDGVRQVLVPWAEPRSRFTMMMETLAIDVLLQASSVEAACRILRITWSEAMGIKDRAVARGLARKERSVPKFIGVDEKAFRKGQSYMTIVCDAQNGGVEYVARGRRQESLESFYQQFTPEELASIEAVSLDMWGPFIQATLARVPDAGSKIVFDKFHIMKHVGDAVDQVRREEHAQLRARGDETLTHTRYLWLYSRENLPEQHRDTFEFLQALNLKVGRAWSIKETLRDLWDCANPTSARRHGLAWYRWARRSRLEPIKRVAKMIHAHLDNIVTYCKHRVTQGVAEGINSKIMAMKRHAGGFRNERNFATAIYFLCGRLDLYPRLTT